MTAMLFSLGYEGTGKTTEPEVGGPEVVMVRVRNVAQDRNHDSRVLKLGKWRDRPKPEVERPEPEVARLMTSAVMTSANCFSTGLFTLLSLHHTNIGYRL